MSDNPKQQRTKRQHWLPRTSYLKNFAINGKVRTYWFKDGDKADFIHTSEKKDIAPPNVGVKNDLYETPILPDNTIEKVFAQIEASYGKILDSKIKKGKRLTKDEHEKVALYVSALENRSILQKEHLNSFLDKLDMTGRSVALGHNSPKAAEDWAKKIATEKEVFFAQGIAVALEMNKWEPLDFCFLVPEDYVDAEFITSDHPVTLVDFTANNSFYGVNQWSKTAENVVPLTPKIALFGNRCGLTGYKKVDYNFVREINHRVLRRANKMIISAKPISEDEAKAIVHRNPQSLLLNFIELPDGRADEIIRKQKEKELSENDSPKSKAKP